MDQIDLLDLANDAVILTDAAGTITYWNQGARRTYGWEKVQAIGQNLHQLVRTQLSAQIPCFESLLREQSHWEGELEQVRRDGERIVVVSRCTSQSGNPSSPWLQINSEITERNRETTALRESEERYRRLVAEDFTGILSIRPDGRII